MMRPCLQCVATPPMLQLLHCIAVCCNVLQRVATFGNVLQRDGTASMCCNMLHLLPRGFLNCNLDRCLNSSLNLCLDSLGFVSEFLFGFVLGFLFEFVFEFALCLQL